MINDVEWLRYPTDAISIVIKAMTAMAIIVIVTIHACCSIFCQVFSYF